MGDVPRRNDRLAYWYKYVKQLLLNHCTSMLSLAKHIDFTGVSALWV